MKSSILLSLALCILATKAEYIQRYLSNGDTINIYYNCYGNITEAERQVWLLQGGPGGSGQSLIYFIKKLSNLDPLGYYCITDYRGVGLSSELRCSNLTQTECNIIPACEREIEARYNLSDFYTQKAAEDVIALVEYHNELNSNISTVLYGVSYGTFWLQKIMQNNGNIADKWIFDGVVLQPWFENGAWQYGIYQFNEKVFKLLSQCLENVVCQKYLTEKTIDSFVQMMNNRYSEYKTFISNLFYIIFSQPDLFSNNFIEAINLVNNIVHNKTFLYSRSDYCDSNPIVYKIVKANELYSDYNLDSFIFHNAFLPIDTMTNDIQNTKSWINEVIRDYRPMITDGEVLVLGGEWDIQTVSENSFRLHEYFLNQSVNSKILIASNHGHGVIGASNSCGLTILNQFITGEEMSESCLNSSNYKNFENADYSTFETDFSNEDNVYYIIDSTTAIVMGVLFALLLTANLIFIGLGLYRRYRINRGIEITMN